MALTRINWCESLWMGAQRKFTLTNGTSIDATGEKAAMCGRFFHPNGPGNYTVTRVGFLFGNPVTKGGGSALTVSLQNISQVNGPPMQPDETQDQTVAVANGDSTFATNTWHRTGLLSASRTLAFGEEIAVVVEYDGAGRLSSDAFRLRFALIEGSLSHAVFVQKIGAPAWVIPGESQAIVVLECNDGSFGTIAGSVPFVTGGASTFGETSTPDEAGVKFTAPFNCKVDAGRFFAGLTQDVQYTLYDSNDNVLASVTNDLNAVNSAGSVYAIELPFSSAIELTSGSVYRFTAKPTSGATTTGLTLTLYTVADAGHIPLHGWPSGACATTRSNGGAWTDTPTSLYSCALRIAETHPSGGGGVIVIED